MITSGLRRLGAVALVALSGAAMADIVGWSSFSGDAVGAACLDRRFVERPPDQLTATSQGVVACWAAGELERCLQFLSTGAVSELRVELGSSPRRTVGPAWTLSRQRDGVFTICRGDECRTARVSGATEGHIYTTFLIDPAGRRFTVFADSGLQLHDLEAGTLLRTVSVPKGAGKLIAVLDDEVFELNQFGTLQLLLANGTLLSLGAGSDSPVPLAPGRWAAVAGSDAVFFGRQGVTHRFPLSLGDGARLVRLGDELMVLGKGGARAVVGTKGVTLEAAAPTCASAPELKAVAGAACVWGEPDTVALASLAPDGALRFCLEHQGRCLAFDPATGAFSRLQVVAGPKADPLGWPALQAAAPSSAFDVETPGVTIRARDSGKVIATIEPGSAGATLLKAPWLDADRLLVIGYVGASGYGDARVFEAKSGRLLYTVKGNAVGTRFAHLKGDEWVNLVDDIDAGRHHFDRVSFATGKLLQRVTFKPPSAELARLEADESRAFAVYANGVVVTLAKGKVRLSTPARCQ